MSQLRTARVIVDYLAAGKVDVVFGYIDPSMSVLCHALKERRDKIRVIAAKSQVGAGFMAAVYARKTRRLAVCVGPGDLEGTDHLAAAAHALREHLPVLFLTEFMVDESLNVECCGAIDRPATDIALMKRSVTVHDPERVLDDVAHAVEVALSGVPGPVHVAIPLHVLSTAIHSSRRREFPQVKPVVPSGAAIASAVARLSEVESGLLYIGPGARSALSEVVEIARMLNWPIVATPQAKGLLADGTPLYMGVVGLSDHDDAMEFIHQQSCGAVLVVGASLASGTRDRYLKAGGSMVWIDVEEPGFDCQCHHCAYICGDPRVSLSMIKASLQQLDRRRQAYRPYVLPGQPASPAGALTVQNALLRLQEYLPVDTRYTVDAGAYLFTAIRCMRVFRADSFDVNMHFGPVGVAIAAAIAVKLADPESPVVCVGGDGSFFLHGQEILTAHEHHLPILFVVLNTEPTPSQASAFASSLGISSFRANCLDDLEDRNIARLLQEHAPAILEIAVSDDAANAFAVQQVDDWLPIYPPLIGLSKNTVSPS